MKYIFDFIEEKKDISFAKLPLTEVDNVIFSRLSYLDYFGHIGKTLTEIAKTYAYTSKDESRLFGKTLMLSEELLRKCANTKRYGNIVVTDFKEISNADYATAFCASVFKLDNGTSYISFRGTDDKIMSLYEDAELAYSFPVPCQVAALQFTRKVLEEQDGEFYLGGHSKGGNSALFAYVFLNDEAKKRVIEVYNNDGPGFPKDIVKVLITPEINEKVKTIVPEDSIIGRLLETSDEYTIIKSSATGGSQHNVFTWIVDGERFERVEKFGVFSEFIEDRLTHKLDTISLDKMKRVTDTVYSLAAMNGIETASDINLSSIREAIADIREAMKKDEKNDE